MVIDEKYRELVEWVIGKKDTLMVPEWAVYRAFLSENFELHDKYFTTDELNNALPIIHAIYTDDYKFEEKKYEWRFFPIGGDQNVLYLGKKALSKKFYLGNFFGIKKDSFTQSEFNDFIEHNDYLTAEMFERENVEED